MLGCKLLYDDIGNVIKAELIDTCWDVNIMEVIDDERFYDELIDTCWDVNLKGFNVYYMTEFELIDTCWDVNKIETCAAAHVCA